MVRTVVGIQRYAEASNMNQVRISSVVIEFSFVCKAAGDKVILAFKNTYN